MGELKVITVNYMEIVLLNLKVAALTLLMAAVGGNVPVELRAQAIEVANYALVYVENYQAPVVPEPVPEPVVVPPLGAAPTEPSAETPTEVVVVPAKRIPLVIGEVSVTLVGGPTEDNVIEGVSFTTDIPVLCRGGMTTSCVVAGIGAVRDNVKLSCDAPKDKRLYLFRPGQTYQCALYVDGAEAQGEKLFTITP